jgi:phosphatidyl-myo-inositol alpha-mannosyltransferase
VKVAIVSPYALDKHGGVQDQAKGIRDKLVAAGHEASLIGPGLSDGTWISVGGSTNIESNDAVAPVCFEPSAIQRVKDAVADADVIHVHEPLLPVVGPAAWIGREPATVGSFHAEPAALIRGIYKYGGPLLAQLIDKIDVLTAASQEAAGAVRAFAPEVEIVPNAVDVGRFPERTRRERQVAFVGRDDPRKGFDVLLAAWPAVRAAIPDAELVVVGPRRDTPIDGVRFEGPAPDDRKREVLATSSIYCAPNLGGESFGITLIEGMAAGCAIVATDLPAFVAVAAGVAEHVPAGNPAHLARVLISLLGHPDRVKRMGEASVSRAAVFDWGRVLPRWIALYERALTRSHR